MMSIQNISSKSKSKIISIPVNPLIIYFFGKINRQGFVGSRFVSGMGKSVGKYELAIARYYVLNSFKDFQLYVSSCVYS